MLVRSGQPLQVACADCVRHNLQELHDAGQAMTGNSPLLGSRGWFAGTDARACDAVT